MRTLLLLLVCAVPAPAQAPPGPPPADGPKQMVSGRVVDADSGRVVRGARVSILQRNNELVSVYADLEGRFNIEEAPVGDWTVRIAKSGYQHDGAGIRIPAAQPLTGLEVPIRRHGVIAGRVTDSRNRPVAGAEVAAYRWRKSFEGVVTLQQALSSFSRFQQKTDDRGEYRLWGLQAGTYVVAVNPRMLPAAQGAIRFARQGVLYPNAASVAEAEKIRLGWGQVREGFDFRLAPSSETRVEVQVTGAAIETPCRTCMATLYRDDPEGLMRLTGAPLGPTNGLVIEGLPPGAYAAHIRGMDMATRRQSGAVVRLEVAENRPIRIQATLLEERPIRGRIVLEDRPDATLDKPWSGGLRLTPPPGDERLGMMTRGMFARLQVQGEEGRFEMSAIPGGLGLQLLGGPPAYLAEVSVGGRRVEGGLLTLPPEGLAEELVAKVRFDTGRLEGTVEDPPAVQSGPGLKPPGIVVNLSPVADSAGARRRNLVRVGPDGRFDQAVPPGTYDAVAIFSGTAMRALGDPEYEKTLRKHTRRIVIRANESTNVTLTLAPAAY